MNEQEKQALDLQRRVAYDFLDAEMIRLLSGVQSDDSLRAVQRRGLHAYEAATGKKVEIGSLELTRATIGLGLMLSLADEEVAILDDRLKQIRALDKESAGE